MDISKLSSNVITGSFRNKSGITTHQHCPFQLDCFSNTAPTGVILPIFVHSIVCKLIGNVISRTINMGVFDKVAVYIANHSLNIIVVTNDVVAANLINPVELVDNYLRISTNVQTDTAYTTIHQILQRLVQSLVLGLVVGDVVPEKISSRCNKIAVCSVTIHLIHCPTTTGRPTGIVSRCSVEVNNDPVIIHRRALLQHFEG
jgi:hypothetical protein